MAFETIPRGHFLASPEFDPTASMAAEGMSPPVENQSRAFVFRVNRAQQGTWPEELGRQADPTPLRPDPNQEPGSWQTESERAMQRAQDLWDAVPVKETAETLLTSLGIAGAVALAAKLLAVHLHPFGKAMAILALALARELRMPVALLATSAAFVHLTDGFGIAWRANGNQDDIRTARDAIKTGCLLLAAAVGAQGLAGAEGAALEASEVALDVPAVLEVPTADGLIPTELAQESLGYLTELIERAVQSNAMSLAARWLVPSPLTLAEQTPAETVGTVSAMSTPRERAGTKKTASSGNGATVYTQRVALPISLPDGREVWIKTTPLRQGLCQELVQRGTWARKDIERYLKTRGQPASILSAQMEYVQVEIRSARNGKDKGAAVVDFGGTIRKDEAGYRFETGRRLNGVKPRELRPVVINEVEWWFDLSEEDHEHLMNLVSKPGLRRADVNSHAVSRIKTALEHGRLSNDRSAPTKVVGTMGVSVIGGRQTGGKSIVESYYRFFPEVETKKITTEDLLRW